jgi:hypothetical protein
VAIGSPHPHHHSAGALVSPLIHLERVQEALPDFKRPAHAGIGLLHAWQATSTYTGHRCGLLQESGEVAPVDLHKHAKRAAEVITRAVEKARAHGAQR